MVQFSDLAKAAKAHPNNRVVHITNHATASLLQKDAANSNIPNLRTILNANELAREITNKRYTKYVGQTLARLEGAARAIASVPTAKVEGITFGLGGLASVDKHNAEASRATDALFVYENGIDSNGFGRLLSFYSGCEASKMPTIVVAANTSVDSLKKKLQPMKPSFLFNEHYGSASSFWDVDVTRQPISVADLIIEVAANNSLSAANSAFNLDGLDTSDFEELSQSLSAAYAVIRSINFEYDKFAPAKLAKEANYLLETIDPSSLNKRESDIVSALRVLFTLWDLYVYERSTEKLEIALSISESLGSQILKAHCLRLINLRAGYSEFSSHALQEAEMIFRRNNQDTMAIYCKNNFLLNEMHRAGRTTAQFEDLITEAKEKCPTLFSMVRLINNAAVAAMLDTQYEKALEFIRMALDFNAMPIHRFGLEANEIICRFVMGKTIEEDELDSLVVRLNRQNINSSYGYHQSIILFNIKEMQERSGYSNQLTVSMLSERRFMPYEDVISGHQRMVDFLAASLPTTTPTKSYHGQRGDFILRTNLVPVIHFGWM